MSFDEQIPFVVVRCPSHTDAEFASRWLAAAVETDRILVHHRKANPEFEHPIEPLEDFYEVQFSVPAMAFVRIWLTSGPAFSLNLSASEWSEAFAYMAEIGFFTRTDQHYQMTYPPAPTPETIARALRPLAATKDDDSCLHPEWLLATMTQEEALRNVLVIQNLELLQRTHSFLEVLH